MRYFRTAFTVLSAVLLTLSLCLADPLKDCAEYAKLGVPGENGDLLCRTGHLLAHDPVRKTPIWVAERLTAEKATSSVVPREAGDFRIDPDLIKGRRAGISDYRNSGYDRGHMAPAADMHWNEKAMTECFYLSNMVPQVGQGMNQGIWKSLEEMVRTWAVGRKELFVFTGPIYDGGVKKTIGKNKVAVPSHIYKIVYDPKEKEAIAFMMPNKALKTEDLPLYIVTVREIEEKTRLNFLSSIEKDLQDTIETTKANGLWK